MCCHGYKKPLIISKLNEEERRVADKSFYFSPEELRYLATCHHTPSKDKDLQGLEDMVFKNIQEYAIKGSGLHAKGVTLMTYFPLLGSMILKEKVGLTEERSFLLYFEGMEKWSHNLILKKLFGNLLNANPHSEKYYDLAHHVDSCSVRLGEIDKSGSTLVYSLYGKREERVDLEKFLKGEDLEFFTVHGNTGVRKLDRKNDRRVIEELRKLPKVWKL